MTINTLIELIRKIEDSGTQQDMRQLAISLVHRFRLDGIERDHRVLNTPGVLPFSPIGHQFFKHRLLLSRLIPGNAINFPNNTLTALERCTLHFMMSSSFELRVRGDEATRCAQLAQFRVERVPRNADFETEPEPVNDEGEEIHDDAGHEEPEATDGEFHEDIESINNQVDIASNAISQCPVENGVIRTQWGAIAVGPLISGIAAGLEPQSVTTRELLLLAQGGNGIVSQQNQNLNIDNRWAATLSGDLAEVTLNQGPIMQTMTVGAPGAWNSTAVPRWYFLSQRENLEMTDAEIRGGLDGLILAQNILAWRQQVSTLRLSQVLDMYYSNRGVFGTSVRACNRNDLFTTVAPVATLQDQTAAFSIVLEKEARTPATISQSSIIAFANAASGRLSAYMPQLNIGACTLSAAQAVSDNLDRLVSSDILIYIDASWTHAQLSPVVATILDGLNVNRFGSRYTLLGANNTQIIVNRTHYVTDMHAQWLASNHSLIQPGLHLPTIIRSIRESSQALMNEERTGNIAGGRSKIALIIPNTGVVDDGDRSFAQQQIEILRDAVPDLRILFLAGGTATRFNAFVQDETRDIFSIGTNPAVQAVAIAAPVITRMQQIPRRIVNPRCGANWEQTDRANTQFMGHVRPGGIVFYRLAPNFMFRNTDVNQRLVITGAGFGSITVCQSRTVENPRSNSTNAGDVTCRQLLSDSSAIELNNACEGHDFIHQCPAVFVSVQGAETNNNFRCTDNNCQNVDDLRFTIASENLECFSGAKTMTVSIITLLAAVYYVLRNFM
jgi:hypothetical protein